MTKGQAIKYLMDEGFSEQEAWARVFGFVDSFKEHQSEMEQRMIICKVPAFNYHGYTLAEVVGQTKDTRGHDMFRVRALHGYPWYDGSMLGTSTAKFYPQDIEIVKECKGA